MPARSQCTHTHIHTHTHTHTLTHAHTHTRTYARTRTHTKNANEHVHAQDGPPLDTTHISSLQLMLSKFEYDGALNPNFQAGQFELPIASITTYQVQCALGFYLLS